MQTSSEQLLKAKIISSYLIWWLVWAAAHAGIVQSVGYSWYVAIYDSLLSNGLLALTGFGIFNLLRFYRPGARNAIYLMVIGLLLAFLSQWILPEIWLLLDLPIEFLAFIKSTQYVRLALAWLMISLMSAIGWLWFYIREQQSAEQRKSETERILREAELYNLREQLQPHFLFNSLNSISALLGSQPEKARKMIQQLSDFLRGTLKKDSRQMATVKEEIDHLQLYLDIEKVRFGHRLEAQILVDEAIADNPIPSLLLQPLLENAIKFGLYDTVGEILISLEAKPDVGGGLIVKIRNPFDSETAKSKSGAGFGLSSVNRRLYLIYARNDLMRTYSENNIFITEIRIPKA